MVFGLIFSLAAPFLASTLGLGSIGTALVFGISAVIFGLLSQPDSPDFQPPDTQTPGTGYGREILTLHGTDRLAGNHIWRHSEGFKQVDRKKIADGGLFQDDVYQPVWGHSFAVHFCHTPTDSGVDSIEKIWMDKKLVFNQGSDASLEEKAQAQKLIREGKIAIYTGTNTQTADTTIEGDLGSGNVPAYRRQCYLVCNRWPNLDQFGNQIPLLVEALIHEAGTTTASQWQEITATTSKFSARSRSGALSHNGRFIVMGGLTSGGAVNDVYSSVDGITWRNESSLVDAVDSIVPISFGNRVMFYGGIDAPNDPQNFTYVWLDGGKWERRTPNAAWNPGARHSYGAFRYRFPDQSQDSYVICCGEIDPNVKDVDGQIGGHTRDMWSSVNGITWERRAVNAGIGYRFDHICVRLDENNIFAFGGTALTITNPNAGGDTLLSHAELSNAIYKLNTTTLVFEKVSSEFQQNIPNLQNGTTSSNGSASFPYTAGAIWGGTVFGGKLVIFTDGSQDINNPSSGWKTFQSADGVTWEELTLSGTPSTFLFSNQNYPAVSANLEHMYVFGGEDSGGILDTVYQSTLQSTSTGTRSLDTIVSHVFQERGLATSDFDVPALASDNVNGFVHGRESGKKILNRLIPAFLFDLVENGEKIVAVKRGGSSVVTIPEDDLGAHELSEQDSQKQEESRKPDLDLPAAINIHYRDPEFDYQESVQSARRIGFDNSGTHKGQSNSISVVDIQTGLVMSKDRAAQLANILLDDAWQERHVSAHQLSNKYIYLLPTDVFTTTLNGLTANFRITEMQAGSPGLIKIRSVVENLSYSSSATGSLTRSTIPDEPKLIPFATETRILDIPALHKEHTKSPGLYVAIAPSNESVSVEQWGGATIHASLDGTNFDAAINPKTSLDSFGRATTVLSAPVYVPLIDNANTVDVKLSHPDMTLLTSTETDLANGFNAALLGDEIIQFATVTSLGDNTYRLSQLRRGRLGTEWAVSQHEIGERFIVLNNVSRINLPQDFRQQSITFRSVNLGDRVEDAENITIEYNNVCQKPYAPVHVEAFKDFTTDRWTIRWVPQVMAEFPALDARRSPVTAIDRFWEFDFYNDNNEIEWIVEIDFLAADLVSDNQDGFKFEFKPGETIQGYDTAIYSGNRDTIKFGLYQLSSEVGGDGRGYGEIRTFDGHGELVA